MPPSSSVNNSIVLEVAQYVEPGNVTWLTSVANPRQRGYRNLVLRLSARTNARPQERTFRMSFLAYTLRRLKRFHQRCSARRMAANPNRIAAYLKRFHQVEIARSTVHRLLVKNGMGCTHGAARILTKTSPDRKSAYGEVEIVTVTKGCLRVRSSETNVAMRLLAAVDSELPARPDSLHFARSVQCRAAGAAAHYESRP